MQVLVLLVPLALLAALAFVQAERHRRIVRDAHESYDGYKDDPLWDEYDETLRRLRSDLN